MKSLIFVVGMTIFSAALIMAFEPSTYKERLSAIGSTDELPDSLQLAKVIEPSPHGRQYMSLNHGLHFTGGEPFLNFHCLNLRFNPERFQRSLHQRWYPIHFKML